MFTNHKSKITPEYYYMLPFRKACRSVGYLVQGYITCWSNMIQGMQGRPENLQYNVYL